MGEWIIGEESTSNEESTDNILFILTEMFTYLYLNNGNKNKREREHTVDKILTL